MASKLTDSAANTVYLSLNAKIVEIINLAAYEETSVPYNEIISNQVVNYALNFVAQAEIQNYSPNKLTIISLIIFIIFISIAVAFVLAFLSAQRLYRSVLDIIKNVTEIDLSDYKTDSNVSKRTNQSPYHELIAQISHFKNLQNSALQLQINPHFISNTLNIASLIAIEHFKKDNDIEKILSNLSDLLKMNISTKEPFTTIKNELDALKKYIEIQKIKYINQFDVEWEIDEKCLNKKIIKLILQPVVENAIVHGTSKLYDKRGLIKISVFENENEIHIKIFDNGEEIYFDKIEEIKNNFNDEEFHNTTHVGLKNVNQRLKLIYGKSYGIDFNSDQTGTTVELHFPSTEF